MSKFNLEIYTPSGKLFGTEVESVKIPTSAGEVEVLPGHVGYVSVLGTGILEYDESSSQSKRLAISRGFVSFLNNTLMVLTDQAVAADSVARDYDADRAELNAFLKTAVYDNPETIRARERLALINSIDQLLSN